MRRGHAGQLRSDHAMNTPAHVIFAAAAFARPGQPRHSAAAVAGALAPDFSLYAMSITSIYILGIAPERVFSTLYFSDAWQAVFRIDNSFILWGLALLVAWLAGARAWMVFAASALMHLALDMPLHHDDGRAHFWPLSDWVFRSPVSYWDPAHHGGIVGPIETAVSMLLCVVLLRRFRGAAARLAICALAAAQLLPSVIWALAFA